MSKLRTLLQTGWATIQALVAGTPRVQPPLKHRLTQLMPLGTLKMTGFLLVSLQKYPQRGSLTQIHMECVFVDENSKTLGFSCFLRHSLAKHRDFPGEQCLPRLGPGPGRLAEPCGVHAGAGGHPRVGTSASGCGSKTGTKMGCPVETWTNT